MTAASVTAAALCVLATLALASAEDLQVPALQSPEGPSQFCRDDAGPPWNDDGETYPGARYHDGAPASPVLPAGGECPAPLKAACDAKGAKAAHLDGPVDCGGDGWFCRILDQPGWRNPEYDDKNFAYCNASDADERDDDGHCHGGSDDSTYGWWIRDHYFRGYAGTLHCCCGWGEPMHGLVNRCDYRRYVSADEAGKCRDANEDHGLSYEGSCDAHSDVPFADPLYTKPETCWTVRSFAHPESVSSWDGGDYEEDEDEEDEWWEEDEDEDEDEEDEWEEDEDEWEEGESCEAVVDHVEELYEYIDELEEEVEEHVEELYEYIDELEEELQMQGGGWEGDDYEEDEEECYSDDDCSEGRCNAEDVCLSNCKEGEMCPTVCMGWCVKKDEEEDEGEEGECEEHYEYIEELEAHVDELEEEMDDMRMQLRAATCRDELKKKKCQKKSKRQCTKNKGARKKCKATCSEKTGEDLCALK